MTTSRSATIVLLRALADHISLKASTGAECTIVELAPDRWYGFIQNYDSGDDDDGFDPDWIDAVGPASSEDKAFSLLMKRHANPGASDSVPFSSLTDSEFKFWSKLAKSLNRKISVPEAKEGAKPAAPKPVKAPTGLEKVLAWAKTRCSPQQVEAQLDAVKKQLASANPKAIAAIKDLTEGKVIKADDLPSYLPVTQGSVWKVARAFYKEGDDWLELLWTVDSIRTQGTKVSFKDVGDVYFANDKVLIKGKLGVYMYAADPLDQARIRFWRFST